MPILVLLSKTEQFSGLPAGLYRCTFAFLFSFYIWSIALPGKTGTPHFDLSQDKGACVTSENLTPRQILVGRVIRKTFSRYSIPLNITDNIRGIFKSKLWRMGNFRD